MLLLLVLSQLWGFQTPYLRLLFARDDAESLHEQKQALCLHMQIGYSDQLIYSYKSQLLAGEDQKSIGMKDRDVISETKSRSPGKERDGLCQLSDRDIFSRLVLCEGSCYSRSPALQTSPQGCVRSKYKLLAMCCLLSETPFNCNNSP